MFFFFHKCISPYIYAKNNLVMLHVHSGIPVQNHSILSGNSASKINLFLTLKMLWLIKKAWLLLLVILHIDFGCILYVDVYLNTHATLHQNRKLHSFLWYYQWKLCTVLMLSIIDWNNAYHIFCYIQKIIQRT